MAVSLLLCALSNIAALNGGEAKLRANLAVLLNRPTFSAPIAVLNHKPAGLPQTGTEPLSARPDIQGAHSLTLAQEENLNSARREWLPSLSVQAVTSRNQGYTAAGANTWSVTGQLTWQLWDGGRRFAHADQARANREAGTDMKKTMLLATMRSLRCFRR